MAPTEAIHSPLPEPRGPLSDHVVEHLAGPPRPMPAAPAAGSADVLEDDDFQLALYTCYELHYRSFEGVDDAWEWEPTLIGFRAGLERRFEERLVEEAGHPGTATPDDMDLQLRALVDADDGPSLSRYLERHADLDRYLEFVVHRSAYHLKEADPHSWALPRLAGRPKAALVEIQADEYGGGAEERMHASLFRDTMEELGLDASYGAYLGLLPAVTLATVNLMSLFGLHRRWRGAIVGHLAIFEMTSTLPNRRYANGLRRLGFGPRATAFFDEHVEADAVHENVAANDLAGSLARESPRMAADILFGGRALLAADVRFASHLLDSWSREESSLLVGLPAPAAA